ncbi:MAG TPA: hypothetical protein VFZ44_21205 [Pyrinomonadaceae bacterium]
MLVILASRYDGVAQNLAARWSDEDVALLTPEGLSVSGWRHYPGAPESSASALNGREVGERDITGVLSRLWGVGEFDLPHIVPEDRAYVGMEMSAFITSWLYGLPCPVLNRPTPAYPTGLNWREEEWTHRAARLGIPVRAVRRRLALDAEPEPPPSSAETKTTVTVVGRRCLGAAHESLKDHALRLAAATGTDLMDVYFSGEGADAVFLGVGLWPDVSVPEIADAILEHLKGGDVC